MICRWLQKSVLKQESLFYLQAKDTALMAHDEKVFQELWKAYFKSTTIKERRNPKLHRQNLPVRFWKYLIEKQG